MLTLDSAWCGRAWCIAASQGRRELGSFLCRPKAYSFSRRHLSSSSLYAFPSLLSHCGLDDSENTSLSPGELSTAAHPPACAFPAKSPTHASDNLSASTHQPPGIRATSLHRPPHIRVASDACRLRCRPGSFFASNDKMIMRCPRPRFTRHSHHTPRWPSTTTSTARC